VSFFHNVVGDKASLWMVFVKPTTHLIWLSNSWFYLHISLYIWCGPQWFCMLWTDFL